jgi:hypothetical protein
MKRPQPPLLTGASIRSATVGELWRRHISPTS